jgi:hypothetical protein
MGSANRRGLKVHRAAILPGLRLLFATGETDDRYAPGPHTPIVNLTTTVYLTWNMSGK